MRSAPSSAFLPALACAAILAGPAQARPMAGTYDCSGGATVHTVTVTADGCTVDGEAAAQATETPLECYLAPPGIRVMTLFDDLTFTYTESDTAQGTNTLETAGLCAPR